jgi:hypothetical protein
MSMYNNILGICEEMGRISTRVSALETANSSATGAATDSVAKFVGEELATQVDAKIRSEMERLLDARFQGVLDTQLDAKLDSMFDMKLDTKVSVAVRRERAFLEASVEESVKKSIVEMLDARLRSAQLNNETSIKGATAAVDEIVASLKQTLDLRVAELRDELKTATQSAPEPVAPEALAEPVAPEAVPEEPAAEPADDAVIIVPKAAARRVTRKPKA